MSIGIVSVAAVAAGLYASRSFQYDSGALRRSIWSPSSGIDAIVRAQQLGPQERVLGRLFTDGEVAVARDSSGVSTRPLLVPQHGDAAIREAPGEIAKRLVRSQGFVAIVRSRPVDQHDGSRNRAVGHR